MKLKGFLLLFGIVSLLCAEQVSTNLAPLYNTKSPNRVIGEYIVILKESTLSRSEVNATFKTTVENLGGTINTFYKSVLNGFSATLSDEALIELRKNPQVEYIEANRSISFKGEQNSFIQESTKSSLKMTSQTDSWGLDRIDQRDLPLDNNYSYEKTGQGVHVYIVGDGIYTNHNEFSGRASLDFASHNFNLGPAPGQHMSTHAAGVVGGSTYGVANNVQLHSVRIFDDNYFTTEGYLIEAIDWITTNHQSPAIINLTFYIKIDGGSFNKAVKNSIESGLTYIVPAGNDDSDACNFKPGNLVDAITAGMTDSQDDVPSSSNYGLCVDILAPGVNIRSALNGSSSPTGTYTGTGVAGNFVAGVAALYLEANPNLTTAQITDLIRNNSSKCKLDTWQNSNILLHTPKSNILLVDDDKGSWYETYYTEALNITTGGYYKNWNINIQGSPPLSVLNLYDIVIWFTGDDWSTTLTSTDQSNLANYLNNDGALFITGQDIGYDIYQSSFYSDYLNAQYDKDDAGYRYLYGKNFLADVNVGISGSGGANNQGYPSAMFILNYATPLFEYEQNGGIGGLYKDNLVYLSFGFEAINSLSKRLTVMQGILDWLVSPPCLRGITTIYGEVTDDKTNDYLVNAHVSVESKAYDGDIRIGSDYTNSSGDYEINLVNCGYEWATLSTSKNNYINTSNKILLCISEERNADIELLPYSIANEDFETENLYWLFNFDGNDQASTGMWERANPDATSYNGPKQLGTTTSGSYALVTGPLAGSNAGSYDIDGGDTNAKYSVPGRLPDNDNVKLELSFSYYFAHASNSNADDFLKVSIEYIEQGVGPKTKLILQELGDSNDDDAVWANFTYDLEDFKDRYINLIFEAADNGSPSLVEAAIDDIKVTAEPE